MPSNNLYQIFFEILSWYLLFVYSIPIYPYSVSSNNSFQTNTVLQYHQITIPNNCYLMLSKNSLETCTIKEANKTCIRLVA